MDGVSSMAESVCVALVRTWNFVCALLDLYFWHPSPSVRWSPLATSLPAIVQRQVFAHLSRRDRHNFVLAFPRWRALLDKCDAKLQRHSPESRIAEERRLLRYITIIARLQAIGVHMLLPLRILGIAYQICCGWQTPDSQLTDDLSLAHWRFRIVLYFLMSLSILVEYHYATVMQFHPAELFNIDLNLHPETHDEPWFFGNPFELWIELFHDPNLLPRERFFILLGFYMNSLSMFLLAVRGVYLGLTSSFT